jgi:hypothetical protein
MSEPTPSGRAQASEVHDTTADSGASPTSAGDEQTTRKQTGHGKSPSDKNKVRPEAGDARVVSDESDVGGPVVIKGRAEK